MNQLIALLDGALQANLSKRQWAAFAVVLRQTMGYRKTEDDLSARRFEQLSGIRRNHIWQAKNELLSMGLLQSRPGQYGEILRLSDRVTPPMPSSSTRVDSRNDAIPVPRKVGISDPETGQGLSQNRPEPVPKQDTTLSNLTQGNHYSTVGRVVSSDGAAENQPEIAETVAAAELHYPPNLSTFEREQAPQHLDGLTPQAAQQVLEVWALKIERGEVRKSRLGLLVALVKARRNGQLYANGSSTPTHPSPSHTVNPQQQQRVQAREQWLEQQAQQGWLRDMARLSGLPPEQMMSGIHAAGGAP